MATRLLRGKLGMSGTVRVVGFAQSAHILGLINFIPIVGPIARLLGILLSFFGVWIGTAAANEFKGWRTILLPIFYIIVMVVGLFFLFAVLEGTALTIQNLAVDFGLTQ
jgi:hypothetical protein